MTLAALLVILVSAVPAEARRLSAAAVDALPVVDGRLDDPVWQSATPTSAFTQKAPHEGASPTERTTVRVVYGKDALYVGVDCQQTGVSVVDRLSRRDRVVERDRVSVALDTRRDGKSAFVFEVSAGGALTDGIRFNDTEFSTDWDENWDARVAVRPDGWSSEFYIPFRVLRFRRRPAQSWGFQVRRYISRKQETVEWPLIPRSAGGEVSRYGRLEGLNDLTPRTTLEIRPFILGRARRQDETALDVATADESVRATSVPELTDVRSSAGLDLKWHLTPDLTLDLAVNPDFAQVEADQLELNLTSLETYYPERRPFFLEGMDLFALPIQLLYTRRVGGVPLAPPLRLGAMAGDGDERLLDVPQPTNIWGASKLSGRIADGWMVGLLQAVTGDNAVPVAESGAGRVQRQVAPLSLWNVARVRGELGDCGSLGLMATGVTRFENARGWPRLAGPPDRSLCPSGGPGTTGTTLVAAGSRCFNDAYVLATDWRWRSADGDWTSNGMLAASTLVNGPVRQVADGTVIGSGELGTSGLAYLGKQGGEHWIADGWVGYADRKFDNNDLGYQDRGNAFWYGLETEYRTLVPWRGLLETHTRLAYEAAANMEGLRLKRGLRLSVSALVDDFWRYLIALRTSSSWFDDREVGDGTALERAGVVVGELEVESDRTRALAVTARLHTDALANGARALSASVAATVQALPQLDFELSPTVTYNRGEPRFVASEPDAGRYVFGDLTATSAGAVLRGTYAFTPRLTLQAHLQLFLAAGHYQRFQAYQTAAGQTSPVVRLSNLSPQSSPEDNPDFEQAALDANVVLRWEWRLGSLLYLVYARSQLPTVVVGPGEVGALDLASLRRSRAADVVILKLSYLWI